MNRSLLFWSTFFLNTFSDKGSGPEDTSDIVGMFLVISGMIGFSPVSTLKLARLIQVKGSTECLEYL